MPQDNELSTLSLRLQAHRPQKRLWRRLVPRAAVAVMLAQDARGPQVLMIRRAERDGDPWSGHMAFPGGRMDRADASAFHCALREVQEEIGVALDSAGRYVGRLSDLSAGGHNRRLPMVVTPFVFQVDTSLAFLPNHEVAETVWVPLAFLRDATQRQRMQWQFAGRTWDLPCYWYEGRRIWGLSLQMLDELLPLCR